MDDAKNRSIKKLVKSNDMTDRQFINMFRIRQAARLGVKIGFNGFQEGEEKA